MLNSTITPIVLVSAALSPITEIIAPPCVKHQGAMEYTIVTAAIAQKPWVLSLLLNGMIPNTAS